MQTADMKNLEIGGFPWLRADSFKEGEQVEVIFDAVELQGQGAKQFPAFLVQRGKEMCKLSGWSLITGTKMFVAEFVGKKAVLTSTGKKWLVKFV